MPYVNAFQISHEIGQIMRFGGRKGTNGYRIPDRPWISKSIIFCRTEIHEMEALQFFRYGVTAESLLEFTPMHKYARVQLPDLQYITARLDYSVPVFNAVIQLCKEIGKQTHFIASFWLWK